MDSYERNLLANFTSLGGIAAEISIYAGPPTIFVVNAYVERNRDIPKHADHETVVM